MRYDSRPAVTHVFLYLRKSTRDEAERQIRSINDQRQDCLALAERLNLTIVEEFVEDRSASRPNNRAVFKALLKELSYKDPKRRRADGILAWHPDRLTRNALEAGQLIQMVDDEQIKDLFFPAYNFHNDTSGKEHLTIEFARAKGYTDRLSEVVCRGVKVRRAGQPREEQLGFECQAKHENGKRCPQGRIKRDAFYLGMLGLGQRAVNADVAALERLPISPAVGLQAQRLVLG